MLGVVKRQRKVDVVCLVWTLVLGFSTGSKRTLASLRRTYQAVSGHLIARSSFHDRLTPALAQLMRRLLEHILKAQRETFPDFHGERMRGFDKLLAMDATILRLHELLAADFPGCRTNHSPAAAKLHMVMNVVDGSPNRIRLTDERTGDGGPWKRLGDWVKGSLLLFDLGYYDFNFFHRIDKRGGYFLSRLKSTANPKIIEDLAYGPGRRYPIEGKNLQEVLGRLKRGVLEAVVEVPVKLRAYRGRRRTITRRFRLVAIRNEETKKYHLYLTNTDSDRLVAKDIQAVYALRWQVEILFKQLRSMGRIDQLPTSKPAIVEVLIYGAILALALSNRLLKAMRRRAENRVLPIRV
jgi:IS4 transposase